MNTYEERNWKYEIPFNNEIYRDVKHFSFLHEPEERKILDKEIDFYRHNFSFEQLLNSFDKCLPEDITHFKEVVYKRKNDILYCPKILQKYYYNTVKKHYKQHSEFLLDMLNTALNKKCRKNPMLPLYKAIFGDYFKEIKKKIHKYSKRQFVDTYDVKILPEDYVTRAIEILNALETDHLLHGIFGEFTNDNVTLYKHIGGGNFEFKSAQFYPGENDSFTIATANNTLKLEELRHNIYANIYPGRGHFYNSIVPKSRKNLDLGANFLLNGWDTFVTWHTKPSGFTNNSKVVYSKICTYLLKGNYKKALKQLNIYLLATYNSTQARNIMISVTQYPGSLESHVMGGLATELLIKNGWAGSPQNILTQYKKHNLGDFFALYRNK